LDLAFSTNQALAFGEAWEVVRLNPRQPLVPLSFARHLAQREPDTALAFVQATPRTTKRAVCAALDAAWSATPNPATLWALTPDTETGLRALGDFAVEQKLFALATQAYERIGDRLSPLELAQKFLKAQRPDRAIAALSGTSHSPAARLALSQAYWQAGRFVDAIHHAESLWLTSPHKSQLLHAAHQPLQARVKTLVEPKTGGTAALARQQADCIYGNPVQERDLEQLRTLAKEFPEDPRLAWILFQTERELNRFEEAAETAIRLARLIAAADAPGRRDER
jgi:predicted Zn-dependent protease